MKRLIALLFLVFATPAFADRDSALRAVIDEEPKVLDAIWMETGWLYVGVWDNGSRRDGFAVYLCQILAEHDVHDTYVKVVDMEAVLAKDGFVELGQARCS